MTEEKCFLWVFIKKLVSSSHDLCDRGRGTGADGFATSLLLGLEIADKPASETLPIPACLYAAAGVSAWPHTPSRSFQHVPDLPPP